MLDRDERRGRLLAHSGGVRFVGVEVQIEREVSAHAHDVVAEAAHDLPCDHLLLLGVHDEHARSRVRLGDIDGCTGCARVCRLVLRRVDRDTHEAEVRANALANARRVFANAAREHDGIGATELRGVCADILADAMLEDLDREASVWITAVGGGLDRLKVAAEPERPARPDFRLNSSSSCSTV
jgi:hypothetical protein